ncbi:unnamed protein product [Ambrosiozyma monospora]|uniref:Unnamed protein product n=1 Tax=Ambrosiozyma monospora TaxID=43982 RepID=A0ACB5TBR5_AMBMO|nr:unnamed protein product [Ambrosiozyma monospora]
MEKQREEEKKAARLREEELKKKVEEEKARLRKEAEERIKLEAARLELSKKRQIRSYYPYGVQIAKFNQVPSAKEVDQYLPLYCYEIGSEKYVIDLQVKLLLGIEKLDSEFSSSSIEQLKQLSDAEKARMWNLLWPMIGSFIRLKDSEQYSMTDMKEAYDSEGRKFQELLLYWVKLSDFNEVLLKGEEYKHVKERVDTLGICPVYHNDDENTVAVYGFGSNSGTPVHANGSLPSPPSELDLPVTLVGKAQVALKMINKQLW